ncbi:uncharacterized protein METZ01_LOCUS67581 [marine metagenome]|uniref:Uncharacterized protein n=1 Tax=marine metagenome TaxID=408172 RepID=A0A381TIY2_9ZZZZ
MDLYDLKKSIESVYYKYCIREGKLPLPDTVYYLWDKKKITNSLLPGIRGTDMQNKERSPRKEKKKKKKPKLS